MRIFILEDSHDRIDTFMRKLNNHEVVVLETAEDAIRWLEGDYGFDIIFLDHDLGGQPSEYCDVNGTNTGSEVVRWMQKNKPFCPVIVHSLNEPAARSMMTNMEDVGITCYRIPFTKLITDLDNPNFLKQ